MFFLRGNKLLALDSVLFSGVDKTFMGTIILRHFSRSEATILLSFLDNFHVGVVDLLFIVKKLQFQDGPQLLAIEKLYMTS